MSEFKEFTGKDVDEAIERACRHFDAKREKLELEILSGGSTGIFGLVGKKKAVVKARLRGRAAVDSGLLDDREKPASAPAAETRPAPRQDTAPSPRQDTTPAPRQETAPAPRQEPVPPAPVAKPAPAPARAPKDDDDFEDEVAPPGNRIFEPAPKGAPLMDAVVASPTPAAAPSGQAPSGNRRRTHRGGRGRRGRGQGEGNRETNGNREVNGNREGGNRDGGNREAGNREGGSREGGSREGGRGQRQGGRGGQRRPEPRRKPEPTPESEETSRPLSADYDPQVVLDKTQEVVARLVEPLCAAAPLKLEHEPGRVKVFVDAGADAELLIGKDGSTLAALQYLANRMVARLTGAAVRIHLDAGEFREQQDEQLRQMALDMAAKAKEEGRTQSTRPLSSYHRRIIHLALQEDPAVSTRSKGDGPLKRVLISPKRGE
jgi:spoIIIJ-associated protein